MTVLLSKLNIKTSILKFPGKKLFLATKGNPATKELDSVATYLEGKEATNCTRALAVSFGKQLKFSILQNILCVNGCTREMINSSGNTNIKQQTYNY